MFIGRVRVSRLSKAVYAKPTDQKRLVDSRLFSEMFVKDEHLNEIITPYIQMQYTIQAAFRNDVWISSEQETKNLDWAIRKTKQSIIEAVFGEFREDMILIQRALYNRDFEVALNLLQNLEKNMFEEN